MTTCWMRSVRVNVFFWAMLLAIAPLSATAGSIDSPGAPDADASKSFSLQDLYNRLDSGAAGTQRSFTAPTAGPGPTMFTINQVMGKAPTVNAAGASAGEVLQGKKFWGLRSGAGWGLLTGTMPNRPGDNAHSGVISSGTTLYVFPNQGYYPPTSRILVSDPDYVSQNIKSGVDIFGKTGTYKGCSCTGTLVGTRWCDNGDGTVTDLLGHEGKGHCLVWLKHAGWGQYPWRSTSTYEDAHTVASSFKHGSPWVTLQDNSVEGDWRLPSLSELKALVNGTAAVSSSQPGPFINLVNGYYWSSTSWEGHFVQAWCIHLDSKFAAYDDKSNTNRIWPVRNSR